MGSSTHYLHLLRALGLGLLGLALAQPGCNKSNLDAKTPVKELRLGYFANLTHAQAVLGVASGEFAEGVAPAKLTTQVFNAGPSLIEALLAGEIDIAYVGPGPVLNAHTKTHGQGIRVIAGAANNGVAIVAREGSGIHTMADLKGKILATPQHGNTQDLAARHYLQAVLHQDNLDNVMPIANSEQSGLMDQSQIDASWAPEPWAALLVAKNGAHLIGEEKDLWPGGQFTLTVVVTTPQFLSAHRDVVERFVQAHSRWTSRLKAEPDKYAKPLDDALFALTTKRLPTGVVPAALARVKFSDQPLAATFESLADWSAELGMTNVRPNLAGLIDTSIVDRQSPSDSGKPK